MMNPKDDEPTPKTLAQLFVEVGFTDKSAAKFREIGRSLTNAMVEPLVVSDEDDESGEGAL